MNFYTSAFQHNNKIYYRGYSDGKRVSRKFDFRPSLYYETRDSNSEYLSIEGANLARKQFQSIRDAKDYIETYTGVADHKIYGMENWVINFLADYHPGEMQFDYGQLSVGYLDIETAKGENGYSEAYDASQPITALTVFAKNRYIVLGTVFYQTENENEHFIHAKDEADMLSKFLKIWASLDLDIVSGWNIEEYDIPYLTNRIRRVLGEDSVKMLSPWGVVKEKTLKTAWGEKQSYDYCGIQILDYLPLFKKFTYTTPENYKLNTVCHMVLGEKKVDYSQYKDLDTLLRENPQLFYRYNIKDVSLLVKLEEKIKLIFLVIVMGYSSKVNFIDCFKQTVIWDSIIYNHLLNTRKTIVPLKTFDKETRNYAGGYVKVPLVGKYKWSVSFDLTSLYPSIYMHYNISPETFVGKSQSRSFAPSIEDGNITVSEVLVNAGPLNEPKIHQQNLSVAANGTMYRKDIRGFVPEIIEKLFDERQRYKKLMLETKKQIETCDDENMRKKLEIDASVYETMQINLKVQINALYGSFGAETFRFYNVDTAEAITLSGQLSVKWAQKRLNVWLNSLCDTVDADYVVLVDTDSLYLNLGPFVEKYCKGMPDDKIYQILERFSKEKVQVMLQQYFDELKTYMNAYEQRLIMKLEKICSGLVSVAKKRYFCDVISNEGVKYSEPKISVTGIEAVRSSTPEYCKEKLIEIFAVVLRKSEEEAQAFIQKTKEGFMKLPVEEISTPTSVNGIKKYTEGDTWKSGTPMHVKGSIVYNSQVNSKGLKAKYDLINDGDKVKMIPLRLPNVIQSPVVCYQTVLPKEFGVHDYINYHAQFDKTFLSPIKTIFETIGWKIEKRETLDDLFV